MGKHVMRNIAGTGLAAAMLVTAAAPGSAESQAQPAGRSIDFEEAAERGRALRRSEASFEKQLSSEEFQSVQRVRTDNDRNSHGIAASEPE